MLPVVFDGQVGGWSESAKQLFSWIAQRTRNRNLPGASLRHFTVTPRGDGRLSLFRLPTTDWLPDWDNPEDPAEVVGARRDRSFRFPQAGDTRRP